MAIEQDVIPIDNQLRDFKEYLDHNDRCIFSARFGDGKSYFLSEFIKENKEEYLFIPIYPVNYQVADNKDIFEYIKRDILFRLLSSGEVELDDTSISNSLYLAAFLEEQGITSSLDLLEVVPNINLSGIDVSLSAIGVVAKACVKIKNQFKEYKSKLKTKDRIAEEAIESIYNEKGSIYEFDLVSQLICDLIDEYRNKHAGKKVVLLIEDLDRIDPAHIFRILNVFSAHFDRYNETWIESKHKEVVYANKFKFDKVITVCHYENIKNIYHHCYGKNTDFNGYIGKFSTTSPFTYSLEVLFKDYISKELIFNIGNFPLVCNALADNIVNKYKDTDSGIWGNVRHIIYNLRKVALIRKEFIDISLNLKISTVNSLTKMLNILSAFNLKWSDIYVNTYYGVGSINSSENELDILIAECWLCVNKVDQDLQFEVRKDLIGLRYKENAEFIDTNILIENGIVTSVHFTELRRFSKPYISALINQKDPILHFFNSYIINSSAKIFDSILADKISK